MEKVKIRLRRSHPLAKLPLYAHGAEEDAGADLSSVEDVVLEPGDIKGVDTGWQVQIPSGYYWSIVPRSGTAFKHGITVINAPGTIDPGYRYNVKVGLVNHGRETFHIKAGDRIAQAILKPYVKAECEEGELDVSLRGEGGFGSSGR